MIYTIGKRETYEPYLNNNSYPQKMKYGSVWKEKQDVITYLINTNLVNGFNIYGVDADWEKDTMEIPDVSWRALTRNAKLIKIH